MSTHNVSVTTVKNNIVVACDCGWKKDTGDDPSVTVIREIADGHLLNSPCGVKNPRNSWVCEKSIHPSSMKHLTMVSVKGKKVPTYWWEVE